MGIDIRDIQAPPVSRRTEQQRNVFSSLQTLLNREIKFGRRHLKDAKKERFYSEMTILLSAGVDIKSALDIIIEEQKQEQDRKLFQQTRESLITGNSFSEGLRESGKFSAYEYFSIKIGEESGNIQSVLKELTRYYTNRIKQRRQLTSALTYPALVLFVAVVAVAFMLNYIVPMFGEIFKRFGGELPALTKMVIHASTFFRSYSYWMVLFLAGLIFIFLQIRRKQWYRKVSSQVLLRMPVIGQLVNTVYLARFCQSMALLTTSRTPMLRSISLVRQMIGFFPFETALEKIEEDILHGKMLYESMNKHKIFNKRTVYLTKVAEEVNQLGTIFTTLNKQFTEELEYRTGIIGNLMEPLLIILVGLMVMVILISMYLPLFQLSTSIF